MHYEFDDILLEKTDIDTIINDHNPINLNYDQLKQDLSVIRDKSTIQVIDKSNWSLNKLERNTFDQFYHLIDLNLSYNILTYLPSGIFDQLLNLQTINLSHNLISELENCVFTKNTELRVINLSNNIFTNINRYVFNNLSLLRKLDFSFNKIHRLEKKSLKTISLEELNLNCNEIVELDEYSFMYLDNLIHLNLSNNKIREIKESIFQITRKIETLNFSNNFIRKLVRRTFANMDKLKKLDFSNNLLIGLGKCLETKPMLNELNLLENPLSKSWIKNLSISNNIRILKLTIFDWLIGLKKVKKFVLLSYLELHVKSQKYFFVKQYIISHICVLTIQKLYMVIQRGIFNVDYIMSNFVNLEFLHCEFLEAINQFTEFNIGFHINKMPKLNHLSLININKLIITSDSHIKFNKLTYLNLTGIVNIYVDFLQFNFVMLEQLNLSFSHVDSISRDWMNTLPYLKFLNMNGTRISVIADNLFQYNSNLEVIFLQDCQIHTIGENAFRNLMNLKEIDLRGNTQLRITQSLLNGISKSAIVFFD